MSGRRLEYQQLVYALRFQGSVARIGTDGNLLKMTASATSCRIDTHIGQEGIRGSIHVEEGDFARFEAELVFTGATTFQQNGTIELGSGGNRLTVSTVGSGHVDRSPLDDRRRGAVTLRIESGSGQFAGASGLIVSNFVLTGRDEITDHHLGSIAIREKIASEQSK